MAEDADMRNELEEMQRRADQLADEVRGPLSLGGTPARGPERVSDTARVPFGSRPKPSSPRSAEEPGASGTSVWPGVLQGVVAGAGYVFWNFASWYRN